MREALESARLEGFIFFVIFFVASFFFLPLQSDYEKFRNEKMRNMENPFKFGTIVKEGNRTVFSRTYVRRVFHICS